MIVKILKCSHGIGCWYNNLIGQNIEVEKIKDKKYFRRKGVSSAGWLISKSDCKIISK